jgi:peptide/nickel transport system permease protein
VTPSTPTAAEGLPVVPSRVSLGRRRLRVLGQYLITVYILVTLIFALPRALPGDPLRAFTDEYTVLSPESREELEKVHGLDGSVLDQYRAYLSRLARGELGNSIASSQPVTRLLRSNLPWTLLLTGSALALSTWIGFRVGVTAAWRRGSARDRVVQVASTVSRAVPEYAVATFLVIALGVVVRLFPISGGFTPFQESASVAYKLLDALWHLVLPLVSLTLGLVGTKLLMVRNMTVGILGQDYMLLARAKGLPEQIQKHHHGGRSTLVPYLNLVGTQIGIAVGGAVFVQEVFAYPGMGALMVSAVNSRDYPVIEACFLVLSMLVLTANLLVDMVATYLDPRTRTA